MRWLFVLPPLLGVAALSAAWVPANTTWRWKLAILGLEFGHWFALLCFLNLLFAVWLPRSLMWYQAVFSSAVMGALLLLPAFKASKMETEFSWLRLWKIRSIDTSHVELTRYSFISEGQPLEIIRYASSKRASLSPCVVVLHTGGWDSGSHEEFAGVHRELASQGVIVLAMQYRLAPQHRWPAQKQDVTQAIRYIREHAVELGIDTDHIHLMGRSAGGQIATACAASMPELGLRSCIAFYAPHDMLFAREYAFEDDILNSLNLLRQYLGGDPDSAHENYVSASARLTAVAHTPPVLLIHGAKDTMVWVKQSQLFKAKLAHLGVNHRYVELPWATHACDHFPSTPGGQVMMRALMRWIIEAQGR